MFSLKLYNDFSNLCLQKKFIDGFINTKKVGWNNQPTKCPLYLKKLSVRNKSYHSKFLKTQK